MLYGPDETPISAGPDGFARIEREEREVFRPETIASFNGVAVVDEHPDSDVTPENWRNLAVGVVLNPRRGLAADADVLLADLVITDKPAIDAVRAGKREISCGYDADYEETGVGKGRQTNILGNHVALVDSGRCGPRCAIGDHNSTDVTENNTMTWKEKLKAAFAKKDEAALTTILDEVPDVPAVHTHVHVHDNADPGDDEKGHNKGVPGKPAAKPSAKDRTVVADEKEDEKEKEDEETKDDAARHKFTDAALDRRFAKIEDAIADQSRDLKYIKDALDASKEEEEEEEEETKDALGELDVTIPEGATGDSMRDLVRDSSKFGDTFQQTVALAEIIAPGITVPTFDKKAKPVDTYRKICTLRRTTLDLAYNQPDTRSIMDEMLQGRDMRKYKCAQIRDMFNAVGVFKRRQNNGADGNKHGISSSTSGGGTGTKGLTLAEVNKRNREAWKNGNL
jgi:hypothetical protein